MNLSGNPIDFIWAFFAGTLVSLTPCVYPILPITIAYIGAGSATSKIKGFGLSLVYVTGISITYASLGIIAVLTGSIFGQFSSQPLVRVIAGLVIALFGFSLLFGWGFRIPGIKLPVAIKPGGYLSCFILGLISGLVISPCVVPALGSILIFVATKKNFIYGALLLFSFAYGMGLLLIFAGTFSSILTALPKSGHWMGIIKKICAVILIASGIYFVFTGAMNLAYADNAKLNQEACFNFSLKDINGAKVTLSEFKNKKSVLLFFWTTWCPHCILKLRQINEIYPSLIEEGTEVLAINIQERDSIVRRFLSRNPVVYRVLLDYDGDVAYCYRVIGVPMFVFVTKEGEIISQRQLLP